MLGRVRPMPLTVPWNARQSAVLCLLSAMNDELHVLLMKRKEDNTAHSGQVSFPGGSFEIADKDYRTTALRESYEEVGIIPETVDVLGAMTTLYITVSNFNVHPFIGYMAQMPQYILSKKEVAYIIEVPLKELFAPETKIVTDVMSPAVKQVIKNVNAYQLKDGTIIWGATAMMLSELEVLMGYA